MMNKLPFLQPKGWPQKVRISGESKYGFSEDDEIIEQALHELSSAIESKDHKQMMDAIEALVDCIMAREGNDDASNEEA